MKKQLVTLLVAGMLVSVVPVTGEDRIVHAAQTAETSDTAVTSEVSDAADTDSDKNSDTEAAGTETGAADTDKKENAAESKSDSDSSEKSTAGSSASSEQKASEDESSDIESTEKSVNYYSVEPTPDNEALRRKYAPARTYTAQWQKYGYDKTLGRYTSWVYMKEDGTYPRDTEYTVDGVTYYFNANAEVVGWFTAYGNVYYSDKNGKYVTGNQTIDGKEYTFGSNGALGKGTVTIGGKTYTKGETGSEETEKPEKFGWESKNGKRYFTVNGKRIKNTWAEIDGDYYYFNSDGSVHTGGLYTNGRWYNFESNGKQILNTWIKWKGKTYYYAGTNNRSGSYKQIQRYSTSAKEVSNTVFYVSYGARVTGVKTVGGKLYNFDNDGNLRLFQFFKNGTKLYFASADGTALKNQWAQIDGAYYYFNSDGSAHTGGLYTNSRWYNFQSNGKQILNTWIRWKGKTYYYAGTNNKSGSRQTIANYSTSAKTVSNSVFYTSYGARVTGIQTINGKIYKFGKDGNLISSSGNTKKGTASPKVAVTDVMDKKAQGYRSNTSYLILVNRSTHKVGIYKGKINAWKSIQKFSCGDGKTSTPTIEGTFTIGIKLRYFDSGRARCWYATQFSGNYLFHSVLYDQNKTPRKILDGRTGVGVSHGCVRLQISNAKWIYDNIPRGTKVIVYH